MKGAPDCPSARCGIDAGCRRESDGSFICICTHDLSFEKREKPCPRNIVSLNSSPFPGNNKARITIHRNVLRDHNQLLNNIFKASSTETPDSNQGYSDVKSVVLVYITPIIIAILLIGLAIISIRSIRWIRIYRMNNRIKFGLRFLGRNVVQNKSLATNMNHVENADAEPGTGHLTLFLLREWIELEQEIGEGCFGKVFRGRLRRPDSSLLPSDPSYIHVESNQAVAIKVLKTPSPAISSGTADREFLREAETVASFSHENILALHGVVINEFNIGPWLAFEYMELGDLAQLLRSVNGFPGFNKHDNSTSKRSVNQDDLYSIAKQVANGMNYLVSRNFVHRDLACRNCLVGERPFLHPAAISARSNLIIKISDFGMSRDLHCNDYYKMGASRLLPVRWMPPEAIVYGKFSEKSDVWSYGVFLWETFSMGAIPYYGHSNEEVITMIVNCILLEPSDSTPSAIRQLMSGCWKTLPSDRFTFSEINARLHELSNKVLWGETEVTPDSYVYLQTLPDTDSIMPGTMIHVLTDGVYSIGKTIV
ncbi:tyrosine-protein kinase transmembrane receptor Ror isoform X2 [Daphnia magna]|uniref:tyrosine-protein kinase transmembrane receptor Ror isoform X2 n=1 Tax=Daphnia magna TaxID=35525 RepID=UPI001E1BB648|nr:tyrosine-protein kinase transmembrane receptor Ror isoform X2 [Daphnia magna]